MKTDIFENDVIFMYVKNKEDKMTFITINNNNNNQTDNNRRVNTNITCECDSDT